MKYIHINGNKYALKQYAGEKLEGYYYQGLFVDTLPNGKKIKTFFTMEDAHYGVVQKSNIKSAIGLAMCILIIVLSIAVIALFCIRKEKTPPSNSDAVVDAPAVEGNVSGKLKKTSYTLVYNRYTLVNDGFIDIMYSNIDEPVTLKVQAEGITSNSLDVDAGEYIPMFKVNVADDVKFPIRAELLVTIQSKEYVVPIVISDVETADYTQLRNETVNRVDVESAGTIDESYYKPETFEEEEMHIGD